MIGEALKEHDPSTLEDLKEHEPSTLENLLENLMELIEREFDKTRKVQYEEQRRILEEVEARRKELERDVLISRKAALEALRKDPMGGLNYERILLALPEEEGAG